MVNYWGILYKSFNITLTNVVIHEFIIHDIKNSKFFAISIINKY